MIGREIVLAHNSGDHERVRNLIAEVRKHFDKVSKALDQLKGAYLARIK